MNVNVDINNIDLVSCIDEVAQEEETAYLPFPYMNHGGIVDNFKLMSSASKPKQQLPPNPTPSWGMGSNRVTNNRPHTSWGRTNVGDNR